MRVMISQPLNGASEKEKNQKRATVVAMLVAQGHEVREGLSNTTLPNGLNQELWLLGKRLQDMAVVDAVYFMDGWEKDRRCRLEYQVAIAYGKVTVNAEWRELKNCFTVEQTLYECFPDEISADKNESVAAIANRIIRLCREFIRCNRLYARKYKRFKVQKR